MESSLTLSPDGLTVTKDGNTDHVTVIGDRPLIHGAYKWTVEVLGNNSHWVAVGVINKSKVVLSGGSYSSSFSASSAAQRYQTNGTITKWEVGDKIQVAVDCNAKTMSIRNGTGTNLAANLTTALAEGDLYPYLNLYNPGNKVRISFD